jgi:16S rRNA (cytosine967-C5)-methyltransferase
MAAAPGSARLEAARALAAVLRQRHSLRELLPDADRRLADPRDRALLRALLRAALRSHYRQRALLARLLERTLPSSAAEIEALLLVALAQIEAGIGPEYAAVSAAVDAAKQLASGRYASLVNALLRRFLRERDALLAALPDDEEIRYNHPRWLIDALRRDWPARWEEILAGNNAEAPLWLRARHDAPGRKAYLATLEAAQLEAEPHPQLPDALRLVATLDPATLPGFEPGAVSVQDGAAQLAADLMALGPGLRVLDACAAPGGKTLHLLEREASLALTALELVAARADALARLIARRGFAATVRAADASEPAGWWDGQPFDRILLDAPCSATGIIRRQPEIRLLRRADDIARQCALQARLLDALWPLLARGGRLVYATCSILLDENSRQIAAFVARTPDARAGFDLPAWFGSALEVGRQNLPGEGGLDGFYYALLEKTR